MRKALAKNNAVMVAAGIFCSRIFGLVRQRVFSHYLGLSDAADVFSSALRVPNFLQNLFGEGVLSASFIPVYAALLGQDKRKDADALAGSIAGILGLTISLIVAVGIVATPYLLWLIAPGYQDDKRQLTILVVRILFPGTGVLVWSAWCLGILNSHGKFFLSYVAPVIWNLAIIATLLLFRNESSNHLVVDLAWGTVVGCFLQFLVQVRPVLKLVPDLRVHLDLRSAHVRKVLGSFATVVVGRGVVQISAFVDQAISTFLGRGVMAAMTSASSINLLPISLFGMAISASELPALSRIAGSSLNEDSAKQLSARLQGGLEQIAFFIVPSSVAFFALGNVIVAALYQSGAFSRADSNYVWGILAGSGVGLLASTFGRLYASTYYAMGDTRSPLRFALVRLLLTAVLGVAGAFLLPRAFGLEARWGAVALTASAGVAGWIEFRLLKKNMDKRIGRTGVSAGSMVKLWAAASVAAGIAAGVEWAMAGVAPIPTAVLAIGTYGVGYFALTALMQVKLSRQIIARILAKRPRI